jgi:hypothetical protein
MCMIPKAPAPPAARNAPRAPDAPDSTKMDDRAKKRSTLASMITTPPGGMGAATTAGKSVLGA